LDEATAPHLLHFLSRLCVLGYGTGEKVVASAGDAAWLTFAVVRLAVAAATVAVLRRLWEQGVNLLC
jgi:microcompartment protein CcmK/EutM